MRRTVLAAALLASLASPAPDEGPSGAVLRLDFARPLDGLCLRHGARLADGSLEFSDAHGFLLGTIHGNGEMPFPHVTVNDVPLRAWSQLVVVKDEVGHQHFYIHGILVHTDRHAIAAGVVRSFRDADKGEPIRLKMPRGGRVGEVWVVPRALTAEEVRADFEANHDRYPPTTSATASGSRRAGGLTTPRPSTSGSRTGRSTARTPGTRCGPLIICKLWRASIAGRSG